MNTSPDSPVSSPSVPAGIDPTTGNPVEPQRVPSSWFGGAIRRPDGLAADSPGRSRRARIPVLFNPLLRGLLFLVIVVVLIIVGMLIASLFVPPAQLAAVHPVAIVVTILCMVLAYLILARVIERRKAPVELAPNRALGLVWGLLGGAAAFAGVYLLITLFGGFRIARVAEIDWARWWFAVLVIGASAGVIEEILYRGLLFRLVEEFTGTWISAGISGLVFGLVHLSNRDATWWGAIAIALEAGLLFAVLYAFTRSLWVLIGFHAAWNIVQGPVLGVIVSGTGSPPSLFKSSPNGPDLLSGGAFGAEASLVTVLVMVAFAIALSVLLVRRGAVVAPMWVRRARQRAAIADENVPAGTFSTEIRGEPTPPTARE